MNKTKYAGDYCTWMYRPGANNSHWARLSCDGKFNYLSKIQSSEEYIGVADLYNGRLCPVCNRPIRMSYAIIEREVSI